MGQTALEMDPGQVGLHFNSGLAYLAAGELEAARIAYDSGMDLAAQQVTEAEAAGQEPPASLWWYLGTAVMDLSKWRVFDNVVTRG